jgi:hypothetical protein
MRKWLADLRHWGLLVISSWQQYAESGAVALAWTLLEKARGKPFSWHVLEIAAIAFLGFAFFNVWRDEARSHGETAKKLDAATRLPHAKIFEGYHELAKERMQIQDDISEWEAKIKHHDYLESIGLTGGGSLSFLRGPSDTDILREKLKHRKKRLKEIDDFLNS